MMKATVLFEDFFNPEKPAKNDAAVLKVPLGVNERSILEYVEVAEDPFHHILVAGHAGSGKSTYLHTIIGSLLLSYTADQVNVWLSDSGTGEFNQFIDYCSPHIKHINISCDSGNYLAFVAALEAELEQRIEKLIATHTTSFYRCCKTTGVLPFSRLVVIIDCFDQFIRNLCETDRRYLDKLASILHRATAVGITFVVTTQEASLLMRYVSEQVLSVFGIHIAMRQQSDSYFVMFGKQVSELYTGLILGEAIVDTPNIHKVTLLYKPSDFKFALR